MTTDPKMNFLTGEYEDITWRDYLAFGLVIVAIGALVYLVWQNHTIKNRLGAQERAITEIAGAIVQGGIIVPDKDGKATVNTILLEAWKQTNQAP